MAENAYLNGVNNNFIHEVNGQPGMRAVRMDDPRPEEKGYVTAFVPEKQIFDTTRKDGSKVDGYSTVNLGSEDKAIRLSKAAGKDENGKTQYENFEMSAKDVAAGFDANRKEAIKERAAGLEANEPAPAKEANGPELG